jgi:hypothetical protein
MNNSVLNDGGQCLGFNCSHGVPFGKVPSQFDSTPFIKQSFALLSRKDRHAITYTRIDSCRLATPALASSTVCARIKAHHMTGMTCQGGHDMTHDMTQHTEVLRSVFDIGLNPWENVCRWEVVFQHQTRKARQ